MKFPFFFKGNDNVIILFIVKKKSQLNPKLCVLITIFFKIPIYEKEAFCVIVNLELLTISLTIINSIIFTFCPKFNSKEVHPSIVIIQKMIINC